MEHKDLDGWVKCSLEMSSKSQLVYSTIIDNMKTAIIRTNYEGKIWIYQSSVDVDGFETGVDSIFLSSDIVDVIKNKC